ncbi:MAG: serine hydrolase, partial [Myxococcota bacterium]
VGTGYYMTENADTFYPLTEEMPYAAGRVDLARHPDNGYTRPAGMVWSTAEDMARLVAFLVEGGNDAVLDDTLRALVTTAHVPMYPHVTIQGYGYGVFVLPEGFSGVEGWHPTPYWSHGGNTLSYTSTWCALPEYDLIVTIQSNGYGDQMAEACVVGLEGFADLPVSATPDIYADVGPLEDYVGTWHDPHTVGTIQITTDGTDLFVAMPDLEAVGIDVGDTLTPYAKDLFTVTLYGQPYEFTFYDGPDGGKQYIVDRLFAAERVPGGAARPAPAHPERLFRPLPGPAPFRIGR